MGIEFEFDSERATNAVLWLLSRHGRLDRIKLLKLVLLADLRHLRKYGRPIVGGHYFAMEFGPVASELYDAVKRGTIPGTRLDGHQIESVARPDEDYLSETDTEVLREVNEKFGNWDSFRLSDLTHRLEAWKKNFQGGKSSYPIAYEEFFSSSEEHQRALELIKDIQEAENALG